ncbi:MAG: hypothetical protein IKD88_07690 [Lachnospiraceae bacterium]|nr:hypothetical protein [Lachnospiraceae bacterium]
MSRARTAAAGGSTAAGGSAAAGGRRKTAFRIFFYVLGLFILAFGVILNSKAALGVPPVTSASLTFSMLLHVNLGNITFVHYCVLILIEILIHVHLHRTGRLQGSLKSWLIRDGLQILENFAFTRVMNLFSGLIPDFATDYAGQVFGSIPFRAVILAAGIFVIGFGLTMVLDMRLVPNPPDGFVQAVSDASRKPLGLTKNLVDVVHAAIAVVIGLVVWHGFPVVNVGTIAAVLGVGRVVALFNYLFKARLDRLTGMGDAEA